MLGVAACLFSGALVVAVGCGGSSGVAVSSSADGASDAQLTGDALAADGSPSGDGASSLDAARDGGDSATAPPRRVFVTYHVYKIAAFGSLDGADALCQQAADSIGLAAATFRAWLADDFQNPSSRLVHSTGPYVTLSNALVAANWAELTSGTLRHPINESELSSIPLAGTACPVGGVWTGTLPNGNPFPGGNCNGWTDPMLTATVGYFLATNKTWTDACSGACTGTASLYCVEQ
jgi:hypothetical protein